MAKFVTIGERLSTTAPAVNKAFMERDPEPILKRAKQPQDLRKAFFGMTKTDSCHTVYGNLPLPVLLLSSERTVSEYHV